MEILCTIIIERFKEILKGYNLIVLILCKGRYYVLFHNNNKKNYNTKHNINLFRRLDVSPNSVYTALFLMTSH